MSPHSITALLSLATALALPAQERHPEIFPRAEPESVGVSSEKLQGVADTIRSWVDAGDAVGAEILIVVDGKTVLHEVLGFRNREKKVPVERGTICRIRSMTKPFVGASILILAETGKLSLDDRVAEHIPAFDNDNSKEITIRQLLHHEGGFVQPGYPGRLESYADLRAAVDAVGEAGPATAPGAKYTYSDAGSATLGAIVAEVSGMPVEDFIRRKIIEPLGLPDTFCNLAADDPRRSRVSCTYLKRDNGFVKYWDNADPQEMKFFRASGGMYSTPMDYARFLATMMDGGKWGDTRVLGDDTVAEALTPSERNNKGKMGYGHHWMVFRPSPDEDFAAEGGLPAFGHGGSDGTFAVADPARKMIVCYFTQSRGGPTVSRIGAVVRAAIK